MCCSALPTQKSRGQETWKNLPSPLPELRLNEGQMTHSNNFFVSYPKGTYLLTILHGCGPESWLKPEARAKQYAEQRSWGPEAFDIDHLLCSLPIMQVLPGPTLWPVQGKLRWSQKSDNFLLKLKLIILCRRFLLCKWLMRFATLGFPPEVRSHLRIQKSFHTGHRSAHAARKTNSSLFTRNTWCRHTECKNGSMPINGSFHTKEVASRSGRGMCTCMIWHIWRVWKHMLRPHARAFGVNPPWVAFLPQLNNFSSQAQFVVRCSIPGTSAIPFCVGSFLRAAAFQPKCTVDLKWNLFSDSKLNFEFNFFVVKFSENLYNLDKDWNALKAFRTRMASLNLYLCTLICCHTKSILRIGYMILVRFFSGNVPSLHGCTNAQAAKANNPWKHDQSTFKSSKCYKCVRFLRITPPYFASFFRAALLQSLTMDACSLQAPECTGVTHSAWVVSADGLSSQTIFLCVHST